MKLLFISCQLRKVSASFLSKVEKGLSFQNVGIFTTIQFSPILPIISKFLKKHGRNVYMGRSRYGKGIITGCDLQAVDEIAWRCDGFLYLGSGTFHPLPVFLKYRKKIVIANPISEEISIFDDKLAMKIQRRIQNFKKFFRLSRKIGVIICSKPGQQRLSQALKLKRKLEKVGKVAFLFLFDEISPELLLNFPDIELWVNTACPRIAIDDVEHFEKPILNLWEVINEL
ncbi:MAG: diphthamide synthesis protein [Candidatus Nanoarchaeia archaeon]|nr:2-(3-amino-3-carboxypropyl)histidine synthase subunit [Candidatus Haiyanarchaeum thermophilum]MCW1302807.1 2-(3-amino-3-carboxypropyl)histidine synthase subunit [Candidatus Haiyanarchaeum thermophilum]MCW1303488.1 2-(3-amino-3-carboxypropyl)histidine synthase subunit [Candidatus Haiyanarchaeum thermophilum]MCW1306668.1 2-(3-amino-3-carboxypropyl)histidine synthase subunit [Candidatus Haiyanarchaeum thermophilum]MCW1307376.1 2-(3-amino-3-carboxypropyl)histidine synthase subunit [Candidatus Ha